MPELFPACLGLGLALEALALGSLLPGLSARLAAPSRWLCLAGAALIAVYAWRDGDFTLLAGEMLLAFAGWRVLPRAGEAG